MKVFFFGNGDFGINTLKKVFNNKKISLVSVVTNPPKKAGRGLKNHNTPIHNYCIENNIKVILNDNLNDINFIQKLNDFNPDLFIVVSYKIMPSNIFSLPKFGSINLHPSILPKYRGASPIQYAIFNDDKSTGVTIFKLSKGVDSGSILYQKNVDIPDNIIFTDLYSKLSNIGAIAIDYTVSNFEKLNNKKISQNSENISKAPKIEKKDRIINWNKDEKSIFNRIRGLSLNPGAISKFKNKNLMFIEIKKTHVPSSHPPGTLYSENKKLYVATNSKSIQIVKLKISGKRTSTSIDFISGYRNQLPCKLNG